MANTKTVAQILTLAQQLAGIEGQTDRHPDASEGVPFFNEAMRRLRMKLADIGIQGLTEPTTGVLSLPVAPPITGERYLEIDMPDGAVAVYGVDLLINGEWEPLRPGSFAQRRDYQVLGARYPTHWLLRALPRENGLTLTAGKIMLFPNTTTPSVNYRVWYLPAWVDITNTAHLVYGHDSWHAWIVQEMVRMYSQKDDDSENTLQEALRKQAELWAEIKKSAASFNRDQPIQRVRARRRVRLR